MIDDAIGSGHDEDPLLRQLRQGHHQSTDRHRRGNRDLLFRQARRRLLQHLRSKCRQCEGVADRDFAAQSEILLDRIDHVVDRRHAGGARFMQMNVHTLAGIQRDLEHGVE
ncbi:hypothetical protein D9M72_575970 [compost metagenome]